MNDKLVLITHNYPYGHRWDFVEDEIPYLAKAFTNIIVLSLADDSYQRDDISIPSNVQIIKVRRKKVEIGNIIKTIPLMFLPDVLSEVYFAVRKLGYHNIKNILVDIFTYKYFYLLIKKHVLNLINTDSSTLYYSYWMNMDAFTLATLKRKGYIRKIVTRTHRVDCFIEHNFNPYRRLILEQMDRIFSVSQSGKDSIEKNLCRYVKEEPRVSVARLGVVRDDNLLNPSKEDDKFIIVSCSNVIPVKRVDMIIDALATITEKKIRWIHFGNGSLIENLKEKSKCLPKNVFPDFKGFTPKNEIFSFYKQNHIDLFINCSESEGVPVSIMEALSFGIPVLATNAGGTGEIIGKECGKLLPVDSTPEQLAEGIRYFMSKNIEEMDEERNNSRQAFNHLCDASKNYTLFADTLTRIL